MRCINYTNKVTRYFKMAFALSLAISAYICTHTSMQVRKTPDLASKSTLIVHFLNNYKERLFMV